MAELNREDNNCSPPSYEETILLYPKDESISTCGITGALPSYDEVMQETISLRVDRDLINRHDGARAVVPASSSHVPNRKCAIFTIVAMILVFILFMVLISSIYILRRQYN